MKIFLISPVANIVSRPEVLSAVIEYVATLEKLGNRVHWPLRDTEQNDPTGGYECCKTNFKRILEADEIHIWYDETSGGSKFDMGGVFMLVEMLGRKKRIVLANDKELVDSTKKSFFKVFKRLIEKTENFRLPYLPIDRKILYVRPKNKFMQEATKLLAESGCTKQPTAAVVVKNRKIIGKGTNSGKKVDVCPRVIQNCKTGTGYEMCISVCEQKGHCEIMALCDAKNNSHDTKGGSLYLDGHWWICKSCWDAIIMAGIRKVFLRVDSVKLYKK